MSTKLANLDQCVLVVVDIQTNFMKPILGMNQALARSKFLIECAHVLEVPMLATEQYPERMGGTHAEILDLLDENAFSKMRFSCCGAPGFMEALEATGKKQAILLGIETPICVNQTAHELIDLGYEVIVAEDTTGARSQEAQRNAIDRMRAAGAIIAHTESIVYEWMKGADHPKFRDVLKILKKYAEPTS
jgi:nicotinamidase-related amidase